MKSKLIVALAMAITASSSAFAQGGCDRTDPPALRFSVAYLSLLETGGASYLDDGYDTSGRTVEQICAEMTGWTMAESLSHQGFEDVVLGFKNETCTMSVKMTDDGKVAESLPMVCTPNG